MDSPMHPLKSWLVKGLCFCVPLEQLMGISCISGIIHVNLRVKGKSGTHLVAVQPPWFLSINKTRVHLCAQILEICSCMDSEMLAHTASGALSQAQQDALPLTISFSREFHAGGMCWQI